MQDEYFLKAKKSLGQHFLRSDKAIRQIVDSIHPFDSLSSKGVIFEIGPGEGVLTEKLLEKFSKVVVIEIDKRSISLLEEKFKDEIKNEKLFIIEKDCLEIDYQCSLESLGLADSNYTLVGNIPYYITGAIFRNTFEQQVLPQQAIFLVQKEVAQRVVANDGKESILSVSVKIFTGGGSERNVKIVDVVKAGSFVPPPKVDSAILSVENIESPFTTLEQQNIFFKILRAAFSHKRKFLLTNLKTDLEKDLYDKYFEKVGEIITKSNSPKARAEDVSIDTWQEIIKII